jgi:hypothetical protein
MKLSIIFLISSFFFLVACEKPNPHPESLDPIYAEFEKELSSAENAQKSAEKEFEGFQKDLEAVAPQTGQIKYAQKRVYETEARIEKLKQMVQYWKIRLETRKQWAMTNYMAAYKEKKPWPDPKEYEEYKQLRKLEQAPKQWNLKERMSQAGVGIGTSAAKPAGEHGEAASAGEHGSAPAESSSEHH